MSAHVFLNSYRVHVVRIDIYLSIYKHCIAYLYEPLFFKKKQQLTNEQIELCVC